LQILPQLVVKLRRRLFQILHVFIPLLSKVCKQNVINRTIVSLQMKLKVHDKNVCLLACYFSPYPTTFQLYDGGQFLLVEERTQCIWEETTDLPQGN
jgi:hypothetical protein